MKQFILIALALALCIYGWFQTQNYAWGPADAPRWNPLALEESGIGRTLARVLTEEANTSYHHGLFERKPPISTNALSQWLDAGSFALGFQGRLKYRPVEKYPLRPFEVKQALELAEKNLRLAFELDPGNYTAYDVYFFFLTTEITQTEFASMAGAQLKDDDDEEESTKPGADTQEQKNGSAAQTTTTNQNKEDPAEQKGTFSRWAEQERQRRQTRAIEITDQAIRKFRPNTMDPERFLTAAVMWYNRFMVLAPDVEERQKSEEARRKLEQIGPPTLHQMRYYIDAAKNCQLNLEQKGAWQALPERRAEYLRVFQLIDTCASALSGTLEHNRARMTQDQRGSSVWGPLGKN
jgi:hypothetical protein